MMFAVRCATTRLFCVVFELVFVVRAVHGSGAWVPRIPGGGSPAHGAKDLESPPSASAGVMSIAACESLCLQTKGCSGVTVQPTSSGLVNCYRKADIHIRQCDEPSAFDTYLRPSSP